MATITPANLSYKDKDGDLGEVKSLTDTDVTLLNNALQDIEDLKLAYSPGFVKRDLSNLTDTGKIAIAHNAMPNEDVFDNLTLGASGTTYVAPADGYVYIDKITNAASQYVTIQVYTTTGTGKIYQFVCYVPVANMPCKYLVPVRKGATFRIEYTAGGTLTAFKFIYAVGSESEKA